MNPSPISSNTSLLTSPAPSPTTSAAAAASAASDPLANENTFLQLLIAQLENQDPESPADGTQFVTELAQFTSLEQETGSRQDLDSINTTLSTASRASAAASAAAFAATTPASGTSSDNTASEPASTTPVTSTTQTTNNNS